MAQRNDQSSFMSSGDPVSIKTFILEAEAFKKHRQLRLYFNYSYTVISFNQNCIGTYQINTHK